MKLYERLGASMRRAPYVWLALTLVLFVAVPVPALAPLLEGPHAQRWMAWLAAGIILTACRWRENGRLIPRRRRISG